MPKAFVITRSGGSNVLRQLLSEERGEEEKGGKKREIATPSTYHRRGEKKENALPPR